MGRGGQNTMGTGIDIPLVGGQITMCRGQNTIGRGFDIQYVEVSKHRGKGFNIPWIRGSIYSG